MGVMGAAQPFGEGQRSCCFLAFFLANPLLATSFLVGRGGNFPLRCRLRPNFPMSIKNKPKMYLHKTDSAKAAPVERSYDSDFKPSEEYRESMPDIMEAVDSEQGAAVPIQQVGVSNFKLPLTVKTGEGKLITLEASITGSVSLEANLKGINMSRIMRSFYELKDEVFTIDSVREVLDLFREKIESFDARIIIRFNYPILQPSLRSGLEGYQYYKCAFEGKLSKDGTFQRLIHFDFIYSSACPCSAELAEHARDLRDAYSIPHSQRSKARVFVRLAEGASLDIEDLQTHLAEALKTETQVMVKREDEQAFAELNGAYIKFVEDAARLVYEQLAGDERIADFQVACSHLESLHSHDAVSVICKGVPGGFVADFSDFDSLIC